MEQIAHHPVFGDVTAAKTVMIYFADRPLPAREGQTVAAALMANGIYTFGRSRNLAQPRGMFCGNGRCQSCLMTIDGVEHVRSCRTLVREGMVVQPCSSDPDVGRDRHEY